MKFSFLLSIPAVLGANLVSIIKVFSTGVEWSYVPMYLVGVACAFVSATLPSIFCGWSSSAENSAVFAIIAGARGL